MALNPKGSEPRAEAEPTVMEKCKWIKPSNPLGRMPRAGIICTGEAYKQVVKL